MALGLKMHAPNTYLLLIQVTISKFSYLANIIRNGFLILNINDDDDDGCH